ncbi:oligosaccharide flippase family protein [Photobacterium sagamiensis]|uniref:oligosaccharide flippase family protein n=1 Tax=Photobacterium sagamiensis TaxID=2910241 RepID=UPI003D102E0F
MVTKKMLKNILSTSIFNIGSQALIFIAEILVARMLMPSDFGAFALALIVVELFSMLSMKSYAMAFVQSETTTDHDLSSIVIVSMLLSIFYVFVSIIFIEPISRFWGGVTFAQSYSVLVWALPVITLEYIYRLALLKKDCFWQMGAAEFASVVLYSVIVTILALLDFGFYSLLYAYLARQVIKLLIVLSISVRNYNLLSGFYVSSIYKLSRMSFAMTLQSIFLFSTSNTDRYFVNLSGGAASIGLYTRALKVLQMPLNLVVRNVSTILYVEFSKKQNDQQFLSDTFRITTFILALIFIPASTILVVYSDVLVSLVYGEKWLAMVPILKVLVVGAVISSLSIIVGDLLKSQGVVYREIISNSLALFVLVQLSYVLYETYGVTGIAYSFVFSQIVFVSSQLIFLSKIINLNIIDYFKVFIAPVTLSLLVYCFSALLLQLFSRLGSLLILSTVLFALFSALTISYGNKNEATKKLFFRMCL